MLAIQVINALDIPCNDHVNRYPYYASVHFNGFEIFRTAVSHETRDPVWQEATVKPINELRGKEKDNNRPLFLESLHVEVMWMNDKNSAEVVAETRIPLSNIGPPQWYGLIRPEGYSTSAGGLYPSRPAGTILIALQLTEDTLGEGRIVGFLPLTDVLDPDKIQHAPLFLNMEWSPLSLLGADTLPGPLTGEILLDRHENVEVESFAGSNSFGDRFGVTSRGSLYLTDLRVIYVPSSISHTPQSFIDMPSVDAGDCRNEAELLALRRMMFQIPLGSIQDCRYHPIDTETACIQITARDSTSAEFVVKRKQSSRRRRVVVHSSSMAMSEDVGAEASHQMKLNVRSYRYGIQSEDIRPLVWCARVSDEICWRVREDAVWKVWARCMRASLEPMIPSQLLDEDDSDIPSGQLHETSSTSSDEEDRSIRSSEFREAITLKWGGSSSTGLRSHWLVESITPPSVLKDYIRLSVGGRGGCQTPQWWICTANSKYDICDTYPKELVFPTSLSEDDVRRGARERSRGRLPSLVWMHPTTRTPLCRSSQPLAGLSKLPEADKKVCIAIYNACPSKLPLRIADARPYINAQANAIQGKGYENCNFLGGPSVAQLFFMDIQNIHVMRESLQKLRDSYSSSGSSSSAGHGASSAGAGTGGKGSSTGDATAGESTDHAASKWLSHVSSVLRGALSVAESILIGHPVLVHCSDGWDRTAQLSALSQLLLDPYYRTVEGFIVLLEKEWMGFGHMFGHRLGRLSHKETSPVFLQFLDCVYQILNQFPSEFEFSVGFLEVVIRCSFSGYFSSFRGNCDKSRNEEVTAAVSSFVDDFDAEDAPYTTVFAYLNVLLHSCLGDLLLNPYYCPPDPETRRVKYLRPRCSPSELILWQQGLMPRSMNRFAGVGGGGRGGLSSVECDALSAGTYARLLHYWSLHMNELPPLSQTRIELLSSEHRGRLFTVSMPHQIMRRRAQYSVIPSNASAEEGAFGYSCSVLPVEVYVEKQRTEAAIKIQHWYRSVKLMNTNSSGLGDLQSRALYEVLSSRGVKEIVRALLVSIFRSRTQLRLNIRAIVKQQVSELVNEFVSNTIEFLVSRDVHEIAIDLGVTASSSHESTNGGRLKKSLAQKLMKKGAKKLKKMKKSFKM